MASNQSTRNINPEIDKSLNIKIDKSFTPEIDKNSKNVSSLQNLQIVDHYQSERKPSSNQYQIITYRNNVMNVQRVFTIPKDQIIHFNLHSPHSNHSNTQKHHQKMSAEKIFTNQTDNLNRNRALIRRGQFQQSLDTYKQLVIKKQVQTKSKCKEDGNTSQFKNKKHIKNKTQANTQDTLANYSDHLRQYKSLRTLVQNEKAGKYDKQEKGEKKLIKKDKVEFGKTLAKDIENYNTLSRSERWERNEEQTLRNAMNRILDVELIRFKLMNKYSIEGDKCHRIRTRTKKSEVLTRKNRFDQFC